MNPIYKKIFDSIYEECCVGEILFKQSPKAMDTKIAEDNLKIIKSIFDKYDITFFLLFGTLLGAVRDKKLIEHDSDVDVGLLSSEIDKFWLIIKNRDIQRNGFSFRIVHPLDFGFFISVYKNNEHVDIHFFDHGENELLLGNNISGLNTIKYKHLNLIKLDFLETSFNILSYPEEYFEEKYGSDWNVPIEGKHAKLC